MIEEKICPKCSQTIENENALICMNCGYALSSDKKLDNPDPTYFSNKDKKLVNTFASLGTLWWALLLIGGIISMITYISILFMI